MSIERQGGTIWFLCDTCSEAFDTEESEFQEALDALRREGWKASKVGADWVHTCPDCSKDRR